MDVLGQTVATGAADPLVAFVAVGVILVIGVIAVTLWKIIG